MHLIPLKGDANLLEEANGVAQGPIYNTQLHNTAFQPLSTLCFSVAHLLSAVDVPTEFSEGRGWLLRCCVSPFCSYFGMKSLGFAALAIDKATKQRRRVQSASSTSREG